MSALEADCGSLFAIWAYKGNALNAAPGRNSGWGEKGEAVYNHCGLGRDQHVVFVRDVELVNAVEVMPSVLEGLYRIEDKCLDGRSWRASTLFMSVKGGFRSEEHTSELQSLMRSSYAVFCLKKTNDY